MLIQQYNSLSLSPIKMPSAHTPNNNCDTLTNKGRVNQRRHSQQMNSTLLPDLSDALASPKPRHTKFVSHKAREVWIDGPRLSSVVGVNAKKILTPSGDLNLNEIWIDGPNANLDVSPTTPVPEISHKQSRDI